MIGRQRQTGYILPSAILLSVAISVFAVMFMQIVATTSQTFNSQSYQSLAQEAALSGVRYAATCLKGGTLAWSSNLTPNTVCSGTSSSGSQYITTSADGTWRSSFSVQTPAAAPQYGVNAKQVVSVGTVQILQGSTVLSTYTASKVGIVNNTFTTKPVAKGNPVTQVASDMHTCVIANGTLYCYGFDQNGELGNGTTGGALFIGTSASPNGAIPAIVGGLGFVSKVSVGDANTCAISNGEAYCWGDGSNGAVGTGPGTPATTTNTLGGTGYTGTTPQGNVTTPQHVGGLLAAPAKVTDISVSSTSWPFPQPMPTFRHSCALSNGAALCWGANEYYQLGDQICITVATFYQQCGSDDGSIFLPPWAPAIAAAGSVRYSIPYPVPVYGYDNQNSTAPNWLPGLGGTSSSGSALYGMKLDRIGAAGHYSCGLGQGQIYCWGIRFPLIWGTPKPTTGGINTATPTLYQGNNAGHNIDPNSVGITGDAACMLANWSFNCMGYSPAMTTLLSWIPAVLPPYQILNGRDVEASSNGQVPTNSAGPFSGWLGGYCYVVNVATTSTMIPACESTSGPGAAQTGGGTVAVGTGGINTIYQLGGTNYTGMNPEAIAANGGGGVMAANGALFTWGTTLAGNLGDGNAASTRTVPQEAANSSGLGTQDGTYAAEGPVSTGGGQSCAEVNGQLYCWGKNASGQLGMGTVGGTVNQPTAVPGLAGMPVSKVSAGANHTCAISEGNLYCWGDNTYNQLGLGAGYPTTTPVTSPVQVSFPSGARVTDVSAGATGTCATADGIAYCWGNNASGQLGTGNTTSYSTPKPVTALASLATTSISMGVNHACAVADGNGYCWGDNTNYELGTGNTTSSSNAVQVTGGSMSTVGPNNITPTFTQISAGNNYTCGIANSLTYCWGKNTYGQAGSGTAGTDVHIPTIVNGTAGTLQATSIDAGDTSTCATLQGTIYCWGNRQNGRIGDNAYYPNPTALVTPTPITGGSVMDTVPGSTVINSAGTKQNMATNISVGLGTVCSVANGRILCWGDNSSGQIGLTSASTASAMLQPAGTSDYVTQTGWQVTNTF